MHFTLLAAIISGNLEIGTPALDWISHDSDTIWGSFVSLTDIRDVTTSARQIV